MLHFLKKNKKNTCRYHYQNLDDMIYGYLWLFLGYRAKQTEIGKFRSFFVLLPPKNQNKKQKKK